MWHGVRPQSVAKRLIQAGEDVTLQDPADRCSVLHEAACDSLGQPVNDLLVGGADPSSIFGPRRSTPLRQGCVERAGQDDLGGVAKGV